MTLAMDDLPNDVALLQRMIVEERQDRDELFAKIKEEAARQLEAQAQRHEAELKAAIAALLRRYYGPRSESFDPRQLLLFGQRIDDAQLDQASIEDESGEQLVTRRIRNRDKHGRQQLP
ncbi:MAG: transposase, partial [Pirellulales bacterium]|nr:transposase [Pirellulales bacterium]